MLSTALLAQLLWHASLPEPQARARALPEPPPVEYLRLLGLGEPAVLSRLVSLWLQAFDNQPGISLPFVALDYERVVGWLRASLRLDPRNTYPLLAASHLYADVVDVGRARRMLHFVAREFTLDPARRWRWMAHAVLVARHRLHDPALALSLARQLTQADTDTGIPGWARQMQIFVLEDMGEYEAARLLIGGTLDSGAITSAQEQRFLRQRLERLRKTRESTSVEK